MSAQVMYTGGSLHLKAAALDPQRIISVKSNLRPNRGGVSGVLLAYDLEAEQLTGIIDAGLMTALRTGAIAGVAAERLVAPGPVTVAVLGVGPVGLHSIRSLLEVLNVTQVRLWSTTGAKTVETAATLSEQVRATPCQSVTEAITGADVIITATPAAIPFLTKNGLKPGAVILAMGADTIGKRELTAEVLESSDVIVDVPVDAIRVGESAYLPEERKQSVVPLSRLLETTGALPREHPYLVFDSVGSSHVDAAVTSVSHVASRRTWCRSRSAVVARPIL